MAAIVDSLARAGVRYQAPEIVSLTSRAVVQVLLALTRALLAMLSWTRHVLRNALELIGVSAPDAMERDSHEQQ